MKESSGRAPAHARKTIGWREWVALPELGIARVKAKVDSGARTSALHAFSVEPFQHENGSDWVRFAMHPKQRTTESVIQCQCPILDRRLVRDSGGHQEERIVIETDMRIAEDTFRIELTLTARDDMMFRMLLGRTAMRGRYIIDPGRSYLTKKKRKRNG